MRQVWGYLDLKVHVSTQIKVVHDISSNFFKNIYIQNYMYICETCSIRSIFAGPNMRIILELPDLHLLIYSQVIRVLDLHNSS